jgi:hypothetical protein
MRFGRQLEKICIDCVDLFILQGVTLEEGDTSRQGLSPVIVTPVINIYILLIL